MKWGLHILIFLSVPLHFSQCCPSDFSIPLQFLLPFYLLFSYVFFPLLYASLHAVALFKPRVHFQSVSLLDFHLFTVYCVAVKCCSGPSHINTDSSFTLT